MSDRSPSAERANQARGAGRGRPGNKASVPPARPKMGVRAKTSDWLLRRDDGENSRPNQSEQGGKDPQNCNRPAPRLSLDGILGAPPPRALHLPIQRSNSDVTISDIAPEDITDQNTPNPHTGTSLHRGYGSTSSLDQQEAQSTTVSGGQPGPSLQTATLIARGEIAGIAADANDWEKGPSQRRRTDSSPETTFLFRKLLTSARSEQEGAGLLERRPHGLRKTFAHYDVQSVLFHMNLALTKRLGLAVGKNPSAEPPNNPASPGPRKSISSGDDEGEGYSEPDEGDGQINELLLSCPGFRNELGGEGQRGPWLGGEVEGRPWLSRAGEATGLSHCTLLEAPRESPALHRERAIRYAIEHLDPGARYYHQHFCGREHQNYFGVDENLGPVVLSVRREKLEDRRSKEGTQYAYRIAFRTSEPWSLRGAVLEDSVPSSARPGSARGLPLKDVLEEVLPELNSQCLHLAPTSPHLSQSLLQLDQQGLSFQQAVGLLYCRAGQCLEEELHSDEVIGPAFTHFLQLLVERVPNRSCGKSIDSMGSQWLRTSYKDYELEFHLSTMQPCTPGDTQQLLRKRHVGKDSVTVVFQELGAMPFTPKNIHSQLQQVFIIVRVHSTGIDSVSYSLAVSRLKDVPAFGPPIPKGAIFPQSAVFRDFLLTKVINGGNAVRRSERLGAMAMRARQERLREMAANFSGGATIDSGAKFSFISLGPRKKERSRHSAEAHLRNAGAVTWRVLTRGAHLPNVASTLAISNELLLLIAEESRSVIFSCSCRDVIGWSSGAASVKIFHEHGDCIALSAVEQYEGDVREIVHRLEIVSRGCETVEMTLLRNAIGQLGFHVNFEGVVADVEPHGHAWKAGLRQGSRLVEICSIAVPVLTHEKMIDLLRTSPTVTVLTVQPHEDGTPRRGCSELCRVPLVEYKVDSRGTPCEYKTPFRRNTTWQPVPSLMSETPTLPLSSPTHIRNKTGDPTLSENSSGVLDAEGTLQYRESPGNQSSCSNSGTKLEMQPVESRGNQGDRDPLREAVLEKARSTEAKYHIPTAKVLSSLKNEGGRESPSRLSRVGERSCLSRCSSNTLSSTASSSSEGKRFGSGDLMDPDVLSLACIRGASTDSGIDTASCVLATPSGGVAMVRAGLQWEELPEDSGLEEEESAKLYLPSGRAPFVRAPPLAGGSTGDLSEISSQSSGSHYSGSPGVRGRRVAGSRVSARPCPRLPPPKDQLIGWKTAADRPHLDEQSDQTECGKLYAEEASYRLWAAGQGEEHLLMLTDHQTSLPGSLSPRRSLCRTQSEESVCGNRKGSAHSSALDHALPNDILFSSTPPQPRTPPPGTPTNESWSSGGPPVDRTKFCDQTVMPLPDTGSGLDWSQLVDAARAFEDQQIAPLCTLTEMQRAEALQISQELRRRAESAGSADLETGHCSPALLTDKVNQLEVILRQLQFDLQKEKQHKAVLQEEVQHLRQDNMRLQEASQSSASQLRKFSGWFYHSPNERQ